MRQEQTLGLWSTTGTGQKTQAADDFDENGCADD
jgi:hypothetical protein